VAEGLMISEVYCSTLAPLIFDFSWAWDVFCSFFEDLSYSTLDLFIEALPPFVI